MAETSGAKSGTAGMTLQTVRRALTFLQVVAAADESPSVREMADTLGINLTTCYHLFNTLLSEGYIDRNPDGTLRLGFEVARLYDGYLRGSTPAREMNEIVEGLVRNTRETAWISTLTEDAVVLNAFVDGPQPVRATGLFVGLSGDEHLRSSGRAVMAFLDEERRQRMLDRALSDASDEERAQTMRTIEVLHSDLDEIRARGWALDDQSYKQGIMGVAAPFFGAEGSVLGAVGVWAPAPRGHEHLAEIVPEVLRAAARASVTLGRSRT